MTPLEICEHLCEGTEDVDVVDVRALIKERNAAINFGGDVTLKAYLFEVERIIKELVAHGISTSYSSMMVTLLTE